MTRSRSTSRRQSGQVSEISQNVPGNRSENSDHRRDNGNATDSDSKKMKFHLYCI